MPPLTGKLDDAGVAVVQPHPSLAIDEHGSREHTHNYTVEAEALGARKRGRCASGNPLAAASSFSSVRLDRQLAPE